LEQKKNKMLDFCTHEWTGAVITFTDVSENLTTSREDGRFIKTSEMEIFRVDPRTTHVPGLQAN
jgi:hypothetical protein